MKKLYLGLFIYLAMILNITFASVPSQGSSLDAWQSFIEEAVHTPRGAYSAEEAEQVSSALGNMDTSAFGPVGAELLEWLQNKEVEAIEQNDFGLESNL